MTTSTSMPGLAKRESIATRLACAWPVWSPMLLLLVYAAPSIPFLLPAYTEHQGETYQPLKTLKFFATRGTAYHKYGPVPNFILAPVYGPTLGYWYLTGSLSRPSDDFPYGFSDPLPQMGLLIWESRIVSLALGLVTFAFLGHRLGLVTDQPWASALAMIFCVATNYPIIELIPIAGPDSSMLAFLAAALGVYLAIIYKGLTPARAFWLSTFAVLSISGKELTAFVFVPAYLGLAWTGWKDGRNSPGGTGRFWRSVVTGVLTGVLGYALLNIVYAPRVWLQRMEYWLTGEGITPEVWGNPTWSTQLQTLAIAIAANLGPGGITVLVIAAITAIVGRTTNLVLLCLPALGALLGAIQVRYGGERFLTPLAVCLTPLVAAGLGQLLLWRYSHRGATQSTDHRSADDLGGSQCALCRLELDRTLRQPRIHNGTLRFDPLLHRSEACVLLSLGPAGRLNSPGVARVFARAPSLSGVDRGSVGHARRPLHPAGSELLDRRYEEVSSKG